MRKFENLSPREASSLIGGTSGKIQVDLPWGRVEVVKGSIVSELLHVAQQHEPLVLDLEIRDNGEKVITSVTRLEEEKETPTKSSKATKKQPESKKEG